MYKIKSIKFNNHSILGNLELDFCDLSGKPVDTVIFAGENGNGKSTVLNLLYSAVSFNSAFPMDFVVEDDNGEDISFKYTLKGSGLYLSDGERGINYIGLDQWKEKYPFHAIFSDVDINFNSKTIETVKSSELDSGKNNRKSTLNLPTEINQLIVDIQAIDDAETAKSYREAVKNGNTTINSIIPGERMRRFSDAFDIMFDNLSYSRVENRGNSKSIIFTKGKDEVTIDRLSSGEKQIVYRGCFLLRDINALKGAFVFIDEPEISLHPNWQKKILDYYKNIFTDESGRQTSQLFVVTHSPFVIHNECRKNDKIIILNRDVNGKIVVSDKPEYFDCNSIVPILDAFNINDFNVDTSKTVVYLEGRTDEKYFNKALEVLGYNDVNFEFQWIGHMKNGKQEEFTGASSLDFAIKFLIGRKPKKTQIFLYDGDTNKTESDENNIVVMTIPKYENCKKMDKGIENALILDCMDSMDKFYKTYEKEGSYGTKTQSTDFLKMYFCDYICSMEKETLKKVFKNLGDVIDRIIDRVNKDNIL